MSPKTVSIALASLMAVAQAIKVTSPAKDAEWDLSTKQEIKWDSVDTDPDTFKIVLINQSVYPETETVVADSVKTSDGSYTMSGVDAAAGDDYQINFISTSSTNSGILAQSQQFSVTSDDETTGSSSMSTASATTSTGTAATTDSSSASTTGKSSSTTGSATGSSTGSATGSSTGASASGTEAPNSGASAVKVSLGLISTAAAAFWMLL